LPDFFLPAYQPAVSAFCVSTFPLLLGSLRICALDGRPKELAALAASRFPILINHFHHADNARLPCAPKKKKTKHRVSNEKSDADHDYEFQDGQEPTQGVWNRVL
jgi:hypothetical protein